MEQKLEKIKDLARKIMTKSPTLFRFDVECKENTVVVRFFDIVDAEVFGMQGKYSEMVDICNFILKNKRKKI